MSDTVKVKVADGYAVYDGKSQVTSGQVTLPADEADRLIATGAVEPVEDKPAKPTTARRSA